MENHFGEKFGNVGRDGEMGLQVPGATYLGLSDRIKMQVLEIWEKRQLQAHESQFSSQSLFSDIMLVA